MCFLLLWSSFFKRCLSFYFDCLYDSKNTYRTARVKYHYASLPMWVEKKICEPTCEKYHFVLLIYVNWKKSFVNPQVCNIIFFFLCESRKPSVQYQLFSSPMWIKKTTCEPIIMQSFFLHHMCWKNQVVGPQVLNIVSYLHL